LAEQEKNERARNHVIVVLTYLYLFHYFQINTIHWSRIILRSYMSHPSHDLIFTPLSPVSKSIKPLISSPHPRHIPLTPIQAALQSFPSTSNNLAPAPSIAAVFSAVQSGSATYGVVPFENSSNGSVVFTLDLLADVKGENKDVGVIGEAYVAVRHCLLGHSNPQTSPNQAATDAPNFSEIKKIYSHPQAWGQCNRFLAKHFEGTERQDVSSTSKAAEIVAMDKTGESAALSSPAAAEVFGLSVLAEGINDRVGNTTRFLIIQMRNSNPERGGNGEKKRWKSLVTFTVDHGNPGALALCLSAFSRHGINLTSINTRPSGEMNWHYIFFVEFEGRKDDDDGNVDKALEELSKVAKSMRVLGSWESMLGGEST
jgi:prephenate dehydratase